MEVRFLREGFVGPRDEVLFIDQPAEDAGYEGLFVAGILAGAAQVAAAEERWPAVVAEQAAGENSAQALLPFHQLP